VYDGKAETTEPHCQAVYDRPQPTMTTESTETAGSGAEIMYRPGGKTANVPLAWLTAPIHAVSAAVSLVAPSPAAPNALASTTWTIEPSTPAVTTCRAVHSAWCATGTVPSAPRVTVHAGPL
jgi:hypothetical protein